MLGTVHYLSEGGLGEKMRGGGGGTRHLLKRGGSGNTPQSGVNFGVHAMIQITLRVLRFKRREIRRHFSNFLQTKEMNQNNVTNNKFLVICTRFNHSPT